MGDCKEDEINMSRSNNKIDTFSSIYNILEFVSSMTGLSVKWIMIYMFTILAYHYLYNKIIWTARALLPCSSKNLTLTTITN